MANTNSDFNRDSGSPSDPDPEATFNPSKKRKGISFKKMGLIGLLIVGIGGLAIGMRSWLSIEWLAEQETELRSFEQAFPVLAAALGFAGYVIVTGFSLPGAGILSIVFGWYFGFWKGVGIVSFASTAGATMAFWISRYLFQASLSQRFGERFGHVLRRFEKDGAYYLFSLRLIPAVPFFVINVLMGLTKIKTATFWWVSQIGMLPATLVFIYAGSTLPSLQQVSERGVGSLISWQLALAFTLLGLMPLALRKLFSWWGGRATNTK